ncbi:hypothetical protein [Paracoccus sp. 228]|uniref:hypothetical protein n=1 Tax=Paracoccus sp. 228 TaxID=1192054 RepID=UPI0005DC9272|nr:hypothetical protein [Paracoccus sp. 228]KIX18476.1 hypothetical protein SY26_09415 [Paracoccus sp. 228]
MTANQDFSIIKMVVIDAAVNMQGNRLLAAFDMAMNGMKVRGCVLTEKADGVVKAKGPIGKTHRGVDISVTFDDPAMARAVTRKAALAYCTLTGREVADE